MTDSNWMIYGATGYTGVLISEEAAQRGLKPILAGRDAAKLRPLAERLDLPWVAISLDDTEALHKVLATVDLVLHIAGPYQFTLEPILEACLATGTHYIDVNGENHLLEETLNLDSRAQDAGIAIIPACGYDAVPTECLSLYVAEQITNATWLEVAHAAEGMRSPSAGTAGGGVELLGTVGTQMRRDGALQPHRLGTGGKMIEFTHGTFHAIPAPWGDLVTAYRSTGVPNITTYMEMNTGTARLIRIVFPLVSVLLRFRPLRTLLRKLVAASMTGPSEQVREETHAYIWASARDDAGKHAEAWLQTREPYKFTAIAAVLAAERVLASEMVGALTPAQAFGADFVLNVPGTQRFDTLP